MIAQTSSKLNEEFMREHSKNCGHKNQTTKLTDWQNAVKVSALQIAMKDYNLLYDQGLLKLKAEEKAREICFQEKICFLFEKVR